MKTKTIVWGIVILAIILIGAFFLMNSGSDENLNDSANANTGSDDVGSEIDQILSESEGLDDIDSEFNQDFDYNLN